MLEGEPASPDAGRQDCLSALQWAKLETAALIAGYLLGGVPLGLGTAVLVPVLYRPPPARRWLRVLATDHRSYRELVFFGFALCGALRTEYYFVVHMLELLESDAVQLLLQAATLNLTKLGQAALVIFLTVYFYAAMGFRCGTRRVQSSAPIRRPPHQRAPGGHTAQWLLLKWHTPLHSTAAHAPGLVGWLVAAAMSRR